MVGRKSQSIRDKALKIFEDHGGILRTQAAIREGIHPRILYELCDQGIIEKLERGLYALSGLPAISDPDLVTLSKKIPAGVVCLVSALYYHHLTVQIPRQIDIAVHKKYTPPDIRHPPTRFYWFSDTTYDVGIETHDISGNSVRIYSREKSIVDAFKYRNKVGVDVAIEALTNYWRSGKTDISLLMEYAKISRVTRVLKPYLEAVMHDQS